MNKHLIPLGMVAIIMAISGSSCHDYGNNDHSNAVHNPSPATDGNTRTGANIVPQRQLQPPVMPRPRMR
jgi:hypothetical protein